MQRIRPLRALTSLALILCLGALLSGCDKCGEYWIGVPQKVCHDESEAH
jgi:hypothetical protein